MQVVVVPLLNAGVGDGVEELHFPFAHIHLLQSVVAEGVWIAAIGGQACATAEWTGVDRIESVGVELLLDAGGLLGESRAEGYVGMAVAGAGGDIDRRVADQKNIHTIFSMKRKESSQSRKVAPQQSPV